MCQSLLRRTFAAFAIGFILISVSASAVPPAWGFGGELGRIWSALFGEWRPKAGCSINPDGSVSCAPAQKLGCGINPDGTPQCAPAPKVGCDIDPNGTAHCVPAPKHGCGINPDGTPRCTP